MRYGQRLISAALFLAALILLSQALSSPPALAGQSGHMGRIVRLEGYGIVIRAADGREIPASQELDLFSGDKVSAGPQSEIRIIGVDGSLFWLGEESVVEMGELEVRDQGRETILTLNLLGGYLKCAADGFDPSRLTGIQVWTENAVAHISEDRMIVIESMEGTKVAGFDYPAKVYGREHPDQVVSVLDGLVCLVPPGAAAQPAREMRESERFLIQNLFNLASTPAKPKPGPKMGPSPRRMFNSSTTTTTTTTLAGSTTTTTLPLPTTTDPPATTTTSTPATTTTTTAASTTTTSSGVSTTTTTLTLTGHR